MTDAPPRYNDVPRARYVIVSDCDAPRPSMVCQWVDGVGYCYMDRFGTKPQHDGMRGERAVPVEAFGFQCVENPDGTVSFYPSSKPPTATYPDGVPRQWQGRRQAFEHRRLAPPAAAAPAMRFAAAVLEQFRDTGRFEVDAVDLERMATEAGLTELVQAPEPCHEFCRCADAGLEFPTECVRLTPAGQALPRAPTA